MAEEQQNDNVKKTLTSEIVRGQGTTYFLDIRLTKKDTPYLSVCTSRRRSGQEKAERNCIFIFQDGHSSAFFNCAKLGCFKI